MIDDLKVYQLAPFFNEQENRTHYDERPLEAPIEFLVIDYTVCEFSKTMEIFTKDIPNNRVSAYYVITQQEKKEKGKAKEEEDVIIPGGVIFEVVPEKKRAWHAGVSSWKGKQQLNSYSIGIENVNKGFEHDLFSGKCIWSNFDPDQIAALGMLIQKIVNKYNIHPTNVVGHADIAPTRK